MTMDAKTLKEITDLAALQYTPSEIAEILYLDVQAVQMAMVDPTSEFAIAYATGNRITDISFRQSIVKLAMAGSTPAQAMLKKMMEEKQTKLHYE